MRLGSCLLALLPSSLALACSGETPDPEIQYVDGGGSGSSSGSGGSVLGSGGALTAGGGDGNPGAGGSALGTGGITGGGGTAGPGAGGVSENSGGASVGGTGGDGSGGNDVVGTPATPYDHGFVPTTVTVEDARAAYDDWKAIHLEDCGGGVWRVPWENAKLDATVSEGIGYGMLLTVAFGDQDAFNGLYAYYKQALSPNTGLMNWLRYGCDAHHELKYNEYPDGAAADADLDVAMALIMADCKWGDDGYSGEATKVISNIRQHMFGRAGDYELLLPGDSGFYHDLGESCVNYSYFAPAYYREFARYETNEAGFWNKAADDSYALLAQASNGTSGLVRNWGHASGGDPECTGYNRPTSYGDDAARTPWRVATDYLWNGTPAAKSWNDKVTSWVKTVGITEVVQWYNVDGSPDTQESSWSDHTVINVGPWAAGSMTLDQATVDEFASEVIAIPSGPNDHDGEYFPRMLKALSLITLTGHFDTCGGSMQ
jgi:endo-1,4-beta-D-glucanase Y